MTDARDEIRNPHCKLCALHRTAEWVCLMGSGPIDAEIMIVGEAPGAREDEAHRSFVGPAGKLLDQLLQEAGLSRKDCYVTNAAKCRPPSNRTPTRTEARTCTDVYLEQEIEVVAPDYILLLGNAALQAVARKSGITKHRGKVLQRGNVVVFPTFHPAAALRNPRYDPELRADFKRFGRMVRGERPDARPTRVKVCGNLTHLKWLRRQLMRARTISYDIETTGLQEWVDGARIVSIGFTWDEGQAAVVPVHHSESRWRDPDAVIRFLKPALERPDARYVAHNGKFDCRWLAASGVFVPQSFDTMLAAHMLDENRSKGLKPLSQILLGVDAYDIGEDLRDAYNAPLRSLAIYNGKDTDYTLRIRNVLLPELKSEIRIARVFKQLIMPASNALTKVERIGLWVDEERLKERFGEAAVNIRRTIAVMREHGAPRGMNPNSPKQLGHWLYGELELPIFDLTRTGAPSTREAVLVQLSKEHVAAKALLKYRKWAKYANTYLLPWRDQRDHHSRLHPTYKLFGTVTGRLSCADPNLQQVPRDTFIRGILGAPPGWLFVEADYSQIELRIAAMLAREKRMLRAFAVGEDLHMVTACMMTGKTPEDVTPEERKKAKAVNFGFLYGMGARKFQIYALENYDLEVSYEEAQRVRSRFFESYPNLRPWHERQRRLANRYSRVQSPIGRVRHLPDVRSHDKEVRAEAERQAINSPVQSFASDLMLVSLVRLDESLPSHLARVVGSVHDQLLFEVRLDAADEILPIIRETMENPPVKKWFGTDLTVAVKVEIKTGQHWGEGKVWAPAVGDKIA